MAESSTIARPYAEAAFKLADAQGKLADWSETLGSLARISEDDRVRLAIGDPRLSPAQVASLFIDVLAGVLSGEARNFVQMLAENRRLSVLPEISAQFEKRKDERESTVEAEVRTAFPLDDAQTRDLVRHLESHTGRRVRARVVEDRELIGGVRVTIGDKVIDASVRAQLADLINALKA